MNNNGPVSKENNDAKLALRQNYATPTVDIYEQDGGLTLVADIPGVNDQQMLVDIDKGVLTLEGVVEVESKGERLFSEFAPTGYYRQFKLPDNLDPDKVNAQLKDGVLTLTLPKAEAAMPKRIKVKSVH